METKPYRDIKALDREINSNTCDHAIATSLKNPRNLSPEDSDPAFLECYPKYGEYLTENGPFNVEYYEQIAASNDFACIFNGGDACPANIKKK